MTMELGSDEWRQLVLTGAAQMDIGLDQDQVRQFARHAELLLEWNRKLNLTAIVDPTQVAVKHFLDAIAPLSLIPGDGRLLDMGTGGGFPGIPLKVVRPHQPMTLIDAVRKKVSFVRHVIRELALPSIEARHIRAETMGQDESQPRFDVIVCRALSKLTQVVQWAGPLLADNGTIVAYRGPDDAPAANGDAAPAVLNIRQAAFAAVFHSYRLPHLGDRRTVAVLKAVV